MEGEIKADSQYKKFITIAAGTATVPKGLYELSVTWDDIVSVFVDGKQILKELDPTFYSFGDSALHKNIHLQLGGKHEFRVTHAELGGFATLNLKLRPLQ